MQSSIKPTLVLLLTSVLPLAFSLAAQPETKERTIVLLSGPMDEHPLGSHEYEPTILLLKHCLDTSPNLKGVRTEAYFEDFPPPLGALERADTIVITSAGVDRGLDYHALYSNGRLPLIAEQMRRGAGLFLLHNSTVNPRQYHEQITEWLGGYFDFESGTGKSKYFSRVEHKPWSMVLAAPGHPISRGVGPLNITEEVYSRMQFPESDPRRTAILLKQADGLPDENTIAWAVQRKDGGRGFGFTAGHYFEHWWNPDFRKLVLNAIVWTAGADVPEEGVNCNLEDPIKVLIVTGHNHPAHDWRAVTKALIHVLRLDPRTRIEVTEDPEQLASDLSGFDSIVLNYNNWDRPGLSEAARKNFEQYVSAGGGLSVIHFANGAFNRSLPDNAGSDWELFRTRLVRRVWDFSQSRHDRYAPLRVEISDASHPITSDLQDFETVDELYYRQAGDLPADILAWARSTTTGEKEPVAWAYPYQNGRVFQTVLGHSEESIRGAATLIRRGVIWSADRAPLSFDPPIVLADKEGLRLKSPWNPDRE